MIYIHIYHSHDMQKKEIKYSIKFIIYSNSEIDFYFISTFIIILIKIYIFFFIYM